MVFLQGKHIHFILLQSSDAAGDGRATGEGRYARDPMLHRSAPNGAEVTRSRSESIIESRPEEIRGGSLFPEVISQIDVFCGSALPGATGLIARRSALPQFRL